MSTPPHRSASATRHGIRRLTLGELSRLGLYAVITASFFFSFVVMLQVGIDEGLLCLVATSALMAISIPIALVRRVEIFEPIWFIVLIVAIGVTGKAFYVCFGPQKRLDFLLLGKEPKDLLFAAFIMAVSLLCFTIGYLYGDVRWRLPGGERLTADTWDRGRYFAVLGILLFIGLSSFAVFAMQLNVSFDRLSDFSSKRYIRLQDGAGMAVRGYLRWGAMMAEIAFYLVFANWVAAKRKLRTYSGMALCFFALMAMAFPIFVSSRQAVILLVIRLLVIWICLRGEPRLRYVAILAAISLVLMGSMLAFRRNLSDLEKISAHFAVDEVLEVTVGGRHFLDLTKTAHVMAAVPEVLDYQYGKTLVAWLVTPVPRSWWPGKPPAGAGGLIGDLVFRTQAAGVPPGIIAELYLNFGLAGVFIGLLAAGFLLRSLYATLRPGFPNKGVVLIYTLLSTRLALGMMSNSVPGAMNRLLQEMVPMILALYIISADEKAPESAGSRSIQS